MLQAIHSSHRRMKVFGEIRHEQVKIVGESGKVYSSSRSTDLFSAAAIMGILALIVINKAGGLIYNRTFGDGLNQLGTNDYLVLAGTFHGVHAITTRLSPVKPHQQVGADGIPGRPDPPSGLEVLETENFRLQCFNTLTGTKFLLFTDTLQTNVDIAMRKVYDLYADYVTKNPFYQLEMPIRCDTFDRKLNSYIRETNNAR